LLVFSYDEIIPQIVRVWRQIWSQIWREQSFKSI